MSLLMVLALAVAPGLAVVVPSNSGSSSSTGGKGSSSNDKRCQCVPDQWEGVLMSVDREYDMESGKSGAAETKLFIHYDYTNKLFSMVDLNTGNKAIADYSKGAKYVMRDGRCRGLLTEEPMRRMCLPDEAELLGEYSVGGSLPISMWQFKGPYNVSMMTTVVQSNCMPLTEEVTMTRGEFTSVSTSMYMDMSLGIKDESTFQPPENCMFDEHRSAGYQRPRTKRRADATKILQTIKNRMYIFH